MQFFEFCYKKVLEFYNKITEFLYFLHNKFDSILTKIQNNL